jgi:hypothetical protein
MDFVKSVAQWCQKQIETRQQALDLMERGVIKTHEYAADRRKKDTTQSQSKITGGNRRIARTA